MPSKATTLHPFLVALTDLIRSCRSDIAGFKLLDLDPDLKSIYRNYDGDELFIINEYHCSTHFRKLHLELAKFGSYLDILHCVFFPEPIYNLPIFGLDIVASPKGISAAIVDLSPSSKTLPSTIESSLQALKVPTFQSERKLPVWGDIFSPYVKFVSLENQEEQQAFLSLVDSYISILLCASQGTTPDPINSTLTIDRHKGQQFYCLQQKRNDKTRNVLAKTFGPDWADRYIDIVLFDCPDLI